jgi:hypothetical protein
MDSVYVSVSKMPTDLSYQEMTLAKPDFLEEVRACVKRRGGSDILGLNYLRAIAEEIGRKYDRTFNPYRNVVPSDYIGRFCKTDEEVAAVVHEMFTARYPQIYQKYYEYLLRQRSFDIRVIYFAGDAHDEGVFNRLGIRKIDMDEIKSHLTTIKTKPIKEEALDSVKKAVESLKDKNDTKILSSESIESAPVAEEPISNINEKETSDALDKLANVAIAEDKVAKPRPEKPSQYQRKNKEPKSQEGTVDQST